MKDIKIEDLLNYRFPENLQVSPEGNYAAFQVAYADEEKNSYKRDVWVIRDGKASQLTATLNASIVAWNDETHLILQRTTEDLGMAELFLMDLNGGEAMPWLKLPLMLRGMKKIADGRYLAAASIDMHDPDAYKDDAETRKKKAEAKKKDADYTVVDEVPYWMNGAGFTNGMRTALFEISADPLTITRVTSPSFDMGDYIIDGSTVYFTGAERLIHNDWFNGVYAYDLTTKEIRTVYEKKDYTFRGLFMHNGKLCVQASDHKEYGCNQTAAISIVEDGKVTKLFKPEVDLRDCVAGDTMLGAGKNSVEKDNVWYTLATVVDHVEIYAYDADFNLKVIYNQPGLIPFMDTDGKKVYFVKEDADHLGEVYVMNVDGSDVRKITSLNDKNLEDKYVALPHPLEYTSNGDQLKGWVLLPKDFDPSKKYPAVLDVHGGPRGSYGEVFFHEMQVWAAQGYVVFFTNVRGGSGRGDAFADIRGQYGTVDYEQLMTFTDEVLKAYPNIDAARVCETGGSYGGFMTNWIIGHTDRFCACASQRSISNWLSFSFISDIGLFFGPDQCGADGLYGQENSAKMWEHSPLKYAENVKTPTLFIHSDQDYRCPLPEGMMMMQAIAARGVETKMVIFHGENHELSRGGKPLHRIRRLTEITDWFNKHTKQ